MPKSAKEIIKLLKNSGWNIKSQKGSHVKLNKNEKIIIIPLHGNRSLGIGLIKAIEKQTGEEIL